MTLNEAPACRADEEIAEALANGEEVIPLNMEPTLVELLDIGVQRLKERPTWKVSGTFTMRPAKKLRKCRLACLRPVVEMYLRNARSWWRTYIARFIDSVSAKSVLALL